MQEELTFRQAHVGGSRHDYATMAVARGTPWFWYPRASGITMDFAGYTTSPDVPWVLLPVWAARCRVDIFAVTQHFTGDFKDHPDSDFAGGAAAETIRMHRAGRMCFAQQRVPCRPHAHACERRRRQPTQCRPLL